LRSFEIDTTEKKGATMATTTGNQRNKEEHMGKETLDKAKNVGTQAMDKAKEVGTQAADKAKEVGGGIADRAKEAVSSVGTMASQAASSVGQAASTVGKRAEEMASSAGADIKKWGDSMTSYPPQSGTMGQVTQAVGETLREGGRYLEDAKLSGMADDVSKMIRRNPVPAVLIGIGVGFILGRAMRS